MGFEKTMSMQSVIADDNFTLLHGRFREACPYIGSQPSHSPSGPEQQLQPEEEEERG